MRKVKHLLQDHCLVFFGSFCFHFYAKYNNFCRESIAKSANMCCDVFHRREKKSAVVYTPRTKIILFEPKSWPDKNENDDDDDDDDDDDYDDYDDYDDDDGSRNSSSTSRTVMAGLHSTARQYLYHSWSAVMTLSTGSLKG